MKLLQKTNTLIFIIFISNTLFSQKNDVVKMIFSAKTFSITENYAGDWGGYTYLYSFNKKNDKQIEIIWEEIKTSMKDTSSTTKILKGKSTITYTDLKEVEKIFDNCVYKIKRTKSKSTELSTYIFKNDNTTYEISDDHSMVCVNDIKYWRERAFSPEKK